MSSQDVHMRAWKLLSQKPRCVSSTFVRDAGRSLSQEWHGSNSSKHAYRFVDAMGRLPRDNEVFRENKVGKWLMNRRGEAKRGELSTERIQMMEDALGVDVLVPVVDFERQLADVAKYRRLHGRLPHKKGDTQQLGRWLASRRLEANTGWLSEAHAQRLDAVLGAEWRPEFKNGEV